MNIVNPIQTSNGLTLNTPYHGSNEERQQELRPDQIVRAVVKDGGHDDVLLDFGTQKLRAQGKFDLQTGQSIDLKVLRTDPQLELQILSDIFGNRLSHYLKCLEGPWRLLPPMRQLLQANLGLSSEVTTMFEQWLSLQGQLGELADGHLLKQLWQLIGLDFERRLSKGDGKVDASLKGALLRLGGEIAGEQPDVNSKAQQMMKTIEFFQLCQVRMQEQNMAFFPLPLPFLEQGFLLMEGQREKTQGEGGDDDTLVSLFLSLQRLGPLRIDLLQGDDGLLLRFLAESQEKADFLSRWEDTLRALLSSFEIKGVSFQSGAQSPAKELMQRMFPPGSAVFEARV